MNVLSLEQVILLKNRLKEVGCVLHFQDACGGQNFSLAFSDDANVELVYDTLAQTLQQLQVKAHFYGSAKKQFSIQ